MKSREKKIIRTNVAELLQHVAHMSKHNLEFNNIQRTQNCNHGGLDLTLFRRKSLDGAFMHLEKLCSEVLLCNKNTHTFISTCSSISFVLIVVYSFSNLKKKKTNLY